MWRYISLLLFIISSKISAQTFVLAMIDTSLCPQDINKRVVSAKSLKIPACNQVQIFDRSIHGHYTLETVLKNLPRDFDFKLYHFNVFNEKGEQDSKLWKSALEKIEKIKPDLLLTAVGFPNFSSEFPQKLQWPIVAAAGTVGFGITPETKLWPQSLEDPKLYLVGHFFPSLYRHHAGRQELPKGQVDPDLLYQKRVKFYIPESRLEQKYKGSSRASALAFAAFLKYCPHPIKAQDLKALDLCLKKKSSSYEDLRLGVFSALKF